MEKCEFFVFYVILWCFFGHSLCIYCVCVTRNSIRNHVAGGLCHECCEMNLLIYDWINLWWWLHTVNCLHFCWYHKSQRAQILLKLNIYGCTAQFVFTTLHRINCVWSWWWHHSNIFQCLLINYLMLEQNCWASCAYELKCIHFFIPPQSKIAKLSAEKAAESMPCRLHRLITCLKLNSLHDFINLHFD